MSTGGFLLGEPPIDAELIDLDSELAERPAVASSSAPTRPLSSIQVSRWIMHLDEQFALLSRGVAKKHIPGSPLFTLAAFVHLCRRILHFILAAPPYGSGNPSRAEQMLRLLDMQDSVTGYELEGKSARDALFVWLDELVRAPAWVGPRLTKHRTKAGKSCCWRRVGPPPQRPSSTRELLARFSTQQIIEEPSPMSQPVSRTQKVRLLSLSRHIKGLVSQAVQAGPSMDVDSDDDLVEEEDEEEAPSQIESVLHTDLEARRTFHRTFKILEDS
jgi:hypothetical protein